MFSALSGCSKSTPEQPSQGFSLPSGAATIYPSQGYDFAKARVTSVSAGDTSDFLIYVPSDPPQVMVGRFPTGYIVDMGERGLASIPLAPDTGYTNGIIPAIQGHSYCVMTYSVKYAKFYVSGVTRNYPLGSVSFQWVYQPNGSKQF